MRIARYLEILALIPCPYEPGPGRRNTVLTPFTGDERRVFRHGFPLSASHAMLTAMGAERALQAIGRIEQALARIEARATRAPAEPAASDARLAGAHARLRTKVEAAIADIDALLAADDG
jgi:hypothetical protein